MRITFPVCQGCAMGISLPVYPGIKFSESRTPGYIL
jgi:hypothetical protein